MQGQNAGKRPHEKVDSGQKDRTLVLLLSLKTLPVLPLQGKCLCQRKKQNEPAPGGGTKAERCPGARRQPAPNPAGVQQTGAVTTSFGAGLGGNAAEERNRWKDKGNQESKRGIQQRVSTSERFAGFIALTRSSKFLPPARSLPQRFLK